MTTTIPNQTTPAVAVRPKVAVFPKGFFDDLVHGKMNLFHWLKLAGSMGVDGVELYPRFFESFDPIYIRRVKHEAMALGLEIPMMCNSPDFTQPDPKARAAEVERTRQMINLTATLGGSWCRVLSGQNRPGLDETEATNWVIDSITALLPAAEAAGVVMVIENHYKDGLWEYPEFAQGTRRYLRILDAIDSPWLRVQYDPSNAIVAGDDQYELLDRVMSRVATMQASDRYLEGGTIADLRTRAADPEHGYAKMVRHGVIGRGLNDYDRIFGALAASGYTGWISIEDGDGHTEEEGMTNLRASVEFVQGKIDKHFTGKHFGVRS